MGYIDIVNEQDEVVGKTEFLEAHKKGLRHRSAQILVFEEEGLEKLLVSQRNKNSKSGAGLFGPSAAGHVDSGETYLEAAKGEISEELLHGRELPSDVNLVEVEKYLNDTTYKVFDGTDSVNREISCLFYTVFDYPFLVDGDELGRIFWRARDEVRNDMVSSPEKYTMSFINAVERMETWLKK